MRSVAWALALAAASCRAGGFPEEREDPAWHLVEVEVEGGKLLVLKREDPAPPNIQVRLSRDRVGVGEVVEAEIRISGATGRHRVEVQPSRPGVRILGPSVFDVGDSGPVTVRFTCESVGRGGIRVRVSR